MEPEPSKTAACRPFHTFICLYRDNARDPSSTTTYRIATYSKNEIQNESASSASAAHALLCFAIYSSRFDMTFQRPAGSSHQSSSLLIYVAISPNRITLLQEELLPYLFMSTMQSLRAQVFWLEFDRHSLAHDILTVESVNPHFQRDADIDDSFILQFTTQAQSKFLGYDTSSHQFIPIL